MKGAPTGSRRAFELIQDQGSLTSLVREATSEGRLGFDTEFMREKTYRARLCLVQIALAGKVYIVDPLGDVDVSALGSLIDSDVEFVIHAGRQDFEIFSASYGVVPRRIFDVQVAAGFAGLGASLPYGRLVQATTGTRLAKSESYTDWCKRPLTDSQLSYAADDVRFLLEAADVLKDRLEDQNRLGWALAEMEELTHLSTYQLDPADQYKRISGRGSLSGRQLAILRELAVWREETAARRDIPRGWVVKDHSLVEIARRAPSDEKGLRSIRGFPAKEAGRSAGGILSAVKKGRAATPVETMPSPPREALTRSRATVGLADALLRAKCEGAGIAAELVATRSDLESLLIGVFVDGSAPEHHRLSDGWRWDLIGKDLVALARGEVALRPTKEPPYVQEVPLG